MDAGVGALLFVSGVAGGIANAIAGGATLITFPAMLAAGLPAIVANASNAVAVTPGHLIAAFADREKLRPWSARTIVVMLTALAGGALGATLLLVTSERLFTLLVPALIGVATLIFALAKQIQGVIMHAFGESRSLNSVRVGLLLPAAVYGGYFGAGLGVILLALLTVTGREDLRAVNALKNLLATTVSAMMISIFITQNLVRWPETLTMLTGALCGGYAGGMLIKVISPSAVRTTVTMIGSGMTAIYAWRYWL